jgi:transposase
MAATSLQLSKTALGASFRRIARHKGGAVAVFATTRQLARLIYRMLRYGHDYVDIGEKAYDHQFHVRRLAALTETAKNLGYTLVPNPAAG